MTESRDAPFWTLQRRREGSGKPSARTALATARRRLGAICVAAVLTFRTHGRTYRRGATQTSPVLVFGFASANRCSQSAFIGRAASGDGADADYLK